MEQIDFRKTIESLKGSGFCLVPDTVRVSIQNSKELLSRGVKYFAGDSAQWLPEYDEVARWLTNNEGRGLFCYGNCGRGKTMICCKIIPLLLNHYCRKLVTYYDAQQMNADIETVKAKHILCIDDIGTENISVKYGERRLAFSEIVDEAEKKGKLLILTTNLSLEEVSAKYGERTMDRLIAITKPVKFKGQSLRR